MIALFVGQAERTLLEVVVNTVPEAPPEAQVLGPVAPPGEAIFIPAVGAGPGMGVREVVPSVTVSRIVLPHGAPRPFGQVGSPVLPRFGPRIARIQAPLFGRLPPSNRSEQRDAATGLRFGHHTVSFPRGLRSVIRIQLEVQLPESIQLILGKGPTGTAFQNRNGPTGTASRNRKAATAARMSSISRPRWLYSIGRCTHLPDLLAIGIWSHVERKSSSMTPKTRMPAADSRVSRDPAKSTATAAVRTRSTA